MSELSSAVYTLQLYKKNCLFYKFVKQVTTHALMKSSLYSMLVGSTFVILRSYFGSSMGGKAA